MNELIPLLEKFDLVKQSHPEPLILIKFGESYFSFRDDSIRLAALTCCNLVTFSHDDSDIPVCDFPFRMIDIFLPTLVKSGYKVGICEMPEISKPAVTPNYNRLNEHRRVTIKEYIQYLNEMAPDFESDAWIIGGILQTYYRAGAAYGQALQKYDPIGFNVGFKEYERKFNTRM